MIEFTQIFWIDVFINIIGIFTIIVFIIYWYNKAKKLLPFLVKLIKEIGKYFYFASLPTPAFYLIYYYFIYDKTRPETLFLGPETLDYLKTISIAFFSGGIFSASMKWVNNSIIFKENFRQTILSPEFDKILSDKFDAVALSNEYLLRRNDLYTIWERVTACKYEQKFPEIGAKIKGKIENDFFRDNAISYYYRNMRMQIIFELLEDNIIKITEITSFTVITHSTQEIKFDFWISNDVEEKDNDEKEGQQPKDNQEQSKIYSNLILDKCKVNKKLLEFEIDDDPTNPPKGVKVKSFKAKLDGDTEYNLERVYEMTQDLQNDREFSFASSRIIDDMEVHIKSCDKLNLYFSSVNDVLFDSDIQIRDGQSFIYRGILLPGEKFKVFIYRSNEN